MTDWLRFGITLCLLTALSLSVSARDEEKWKKSSRSLSVEAINSTSINLKWSEDLGGAYAGDGLNTGVTCPTLRYLIRLKQNEVGRVRTWKVEGSRQSVSLHGLIPSTDYLVRLVAITCDGRNRPSRWVTFRTSDQSPYRQGDSDTLQETVAPGQPIGVSTTALTDSAIVSWQPPEEGVLIRGYVIGYGEGVPDVNWQYLEAHRRNVTIKNLKKSTQYVISLRAFNNVGKGPVVYDLVYTRNSTDTKSSVLSRPINLQSRVLSPTTVWLQWNDASLGRKQIVNDSRYYSVSYRALPSGRNMTVVVRDLHTVLYHLVPATLYEFKVRSIKDSQPGAFSHPIINRTLEAAPGSAPRQVRIVSAPGDLTTALISWKQPKQPNGNITEYVILYTWGEEWLPQPDRWQSITVPSPALDATLRSLNRSTTYYFRMQARNAQGYGPKSDVIRLDTTVVLNPSQGVSGLKPSGVASNRLPDSLNITDNEDENEEYEYPDVVDVETSDLSLVQSLHSTSAYRESIKTKREPNPDKSLNRDTSPDASRVIQGESLQYKTSENKAGLNLSGSVTPPDQTRQNEIDKPKVSFRHMVKIHVSVYITWPEQPEVTSCGQDQDMTGRVVGYKIKYWRLPTANDFPQGSLSEKKNDGNDSVTISLRENMILIDDLDVGERYRYQLKYLIEERKQGSAGMERKETDWSQTEDFVTQLV